VWLIVRTLAALNDSYTHLPDRGLSPPVVESGSGAYFPVRLFHMTVLGTLSRTWDSLSHASPLRDNRFRPELELLDLRDVPAVLVVSPPPVSPPPPPPVVCGPAPICCPPTPIVCQPTPIGCQPSPIGCSPTPVDCHGDQGHCGGGWEGTSSWGNSGCAPQQGSWSTQAGCGGALLVSFCF